MIEMSRQAAEHRAQSLLKDLEEEIAVLKKRGAALSQLAVSEDYVHFLKVWMDDQSVLLLMCKIPVYETNFLSTKSSNYCLTVSFVLKSGKNSKI